MDEFEMITIDMESGVWEDGLGKHLRFSAVDLGVAIAVDLLHVEQVDQDRQATATIALAENLPRLMLEALDRALNCPGCGVDHDEEG